MKNNYLLTMASLLLLQIQVNAGLVAHWDFNEGSGTVLHDKSANGNDGTITGAVWEPGLSGSSLHFNGTDNYVELSNAAPFKLQHVTIACWIKPEDPFASTHRDFFSNIEAYSGVSNGIILRFQGNYLDFCLARADGAGHWLNLDKSVTFSQDSYHFAACTYDGATMKLFFDSAQVGQLTYSGGIEYSNVKPHIGASLGDQSYPGYFKGTIDEMSVYDRALSGTELLSLYKNKNNTIITANILIAIASPTHNRRPVFSWHTIQNAGAYNIKIDTSNTFLHPIVSTATADTFYTIAVDLPIDTLFWQIIAGVNDTLSYFSPVGSFIIQDSAVPILIPYTPKITKERKPVFSWRTVTGAASYTIEIGTEALFANSPFTIPVTDTHYVTTVNLPYGPVFWHVKSNLSSAWSTADMFQIVPDTIPFIDRYNGSKVSTTKPIFTWHPVVGASSYTIQLADNLSFTGGYTVPLNDTTFTPPVGLINGVWYWQVCSSKYPSVFCVPDSLYISATQVLAADKPMGRPFAIWSFKNRMAITGNPSTKGNAEFTLVTLTGKKALKLSWIPGNSTITFDVSSIPAGLYLMEIKVGKTRWRDKVFVGK